MQFKNTYILRRFLSSLTGVLFCVISALTLRVGTASAAPASGRPFIATAPDGREVEVIAIGDEHSRHFVYAGSGLKVDWLPAVTQTIGVTPLKKELLVNDAAQPYVHPLPLHQIGLSGQAVTTSKASPSGTSEEASAKFLVILVDFPDRPFTTANPPAAFEEIMNGEEMPARGSYASARRYFEEQSQGLFIPDFEVVGPVTMSRNASYYASVGVDDSPTGKVVMEACQQLENVLDFTRYDLDSDGVCDNIYIFFAGKGQADGGGSTTIWPHSARLDADWGITLDVDGVRISNYACSAELNGAGRFSGIGTFCHEFCHVLGLPDLYYSGVPHPQYFSLMASGNYNGDGYYPPNLSSYERYALGWLSPEQIICTDWITMEPMPENANAKIVKTGNENEYFLLENRQKEGWDRYLPGHGLLIWHIDFDDSAWENNIPNADRNHQRVFLVRANNNLNGYPGASAPFPGTSGVDSFGPYTTPAFTDWEGRPVDCALSTISETASGNITFHAATSRAAIDEIISDPTSPSYTNLPDGLYTLDGRRLSSSTPSSLTSLHLSPGIYIRVLDGHPSKVLIRN